MDFDLKDFCLNLPQNFSIFSHDEKGRYLNAWNGFKNFTIEIQESIFGYGQDFLNNVKQHGLQGLLSLGNEFTSSPQNGTKDKVKNCQGKELLSEWPFVLGIVLGAVFITVLFSFFKTRKRLFPTCLIGRPAIVYPIDFITDHTGRAAYGAVFTLIAYRTMQMFSGQYYFIDPKAFHVDNDATKDLVWPGLSAVRQMINILLVGFVFYPFLVCIGLRRNILANIFGLLYLAPWMYEAIDKAIDIFPICLNTADQTQRIDGMIVLNMEIPQYIVLLLLLVFFSLGLIRNLRRLFKQEVNPEGLEIAVERDADEEYYIKYTIGLMNRKQKEFPTTFVKRLMKKLSYEKVEGFIYSPRITCTMICAAFGIYMLGTKLKVFGTVLREFYHGVNDAALPGVALVYQAITGEPVNNTLLRARAESMVLLFFASWDLALALAGIVQLVFMIHMIIVYRQQMIKLIQGNNRFHYRKILQDSPSTLLVAQMRYSGYQIAYMMYGFGILFVLLFFAFIFIGLFIILPIMDGRSSFVLKLLEKQWPNILLAFTLYYIQIILSKFAFLQERGKYLALDNRRVYHVITYFMFLYNIILGLISCLKRILLSVVFGTLLMSRLDRVLLMKGFENFDSGHKAYLAMLYVDLHHNHPVMRAFISILKEAATETKMKHTYHQFGDSAVSSEKQMNGISLCHPISKKDKMERLRRRKLIRNKWWKYVTLLNNPSLLLEETLKVIKHDGLRALPVFQTDIESGESERRELEDGQIELERKRTTC